MSERAEKVQWGNRDAGRVWRYPNYAAAKAALRMHGGALVMRRVDRLTGRPGDWQEPAPPTPTPRQEPDDERRSEDG